MGWGPGPPLQVLGSLWQFILPTGLACGAKPVCLHTTRQQCNQHTPLQNCSQYGLCAETLCNVLHDDHDYI